MSRQNQKATAKQKSHSKTKRHGKAKTTATQNSLGKMKNSQQNKKATAKQKRNGKIIKVTVKLKSHDK